MLVELLSKLIDFLLKNFWDNLDFWRILAIVLFCLFVLILTLRNQIRNKILNEKFQTHDRDIYSKSNALMNEEQFNDYTETLGILRDVSGKSRKADAFRFFFKQVGNQYADPKLKKYSMKFVNKLNELMICVATHFFTYPDSQTMDDYDNITFAFYPEVMHGPPDTSKYQEAIKHREELFKILDDSIKLYRIYRKHVKTHLAL